MRYSIWVVAGGWMQTCQYRPQETLLIGVVNVNCRFLLCYVFRRFNKATAVHRTIFCDTYYKFHNALDHKITTTWLPAVTLCQQFADDGIEIDVFSCVDILRSCREICWHPHYVSIFQLAIHNNVRSGVNANGPDTRHWLVNIHRMLIWATTEVSLLPSVGWKLSASQCRDTQWLRSK